MEQMLNQNNESFEHQNGAADGGNSRHGGRQRTNTMGHSQLYRAPDGKMYQRKPTVRISQTTEQQAQIQQQTT